ncbi:sensor histidine kinase [Lactobacillus sp. PV034]|uniref:sensor histidine kinase n=1 Tax=Lactobacillus sp. PV034 TaxID=2594495 RepID=UPI00223FF111|nr:HAMP domain-containing sensor histidine kinase [Lactobacillus sp. PV034]QNQ80202.1 HAMP domain-containing histidine kinase [Lactobacillus sp. PV034]
MIQKFRWHFIFLSIASLFLVLIFTLGGLLVITYHQSSSEEQRVLTALVKNDGGLTPQNAKPVLGQQNNVIDSNFLSGPFNPETVFQYHYFTVEVGPEGEFTLQNNAARNKIDQDQVFSKSKQILAKNIKSGRVYFDKNIYAFRKSKTEDGQKIIIFLNETLIFNRYFTLLRVSLYLGSFALLVFALVLILLSGRAIKPITETYKKQKEFITNAGHELKTPLAIISANTEMQEMLGNDSEWLESTKDQVNRLQTLINRLIEVARTREKRDLTLSRINFSKVVTKSAASFKSIMEQKHLHYDVEVTPDLYVNAELHSLTEIVNVLLDNAAKYCDSDGNVSVSLQKSRLGKTAVLKVANTFANGKRVDYRRFFDRFYRGDTSHNSEKKGFGIGLAMIHDMVQLFGGKITVHWKDGVIYFNVNLKLVK